MTSAPSKKKQQSIIVNEFVDELVRGGVIGMLASAKSLAINGGCIYSTIQASKYCQMVFDPATMRLNNRLRGIVKLSLNLVSEDLYQAISIALTKRCTFVPKAVLNDRIVKFSATHFLALTTQSFFVSSVRPLSERECCPLLLACRVIICRTTQFR